MKKHRFNQETRKVFYTMLLILVLLPIIFTFGGLIMLIGIFALFIGFGVIETLVFDEPKEIQTKLNT